MDYVFDVVFLLMNDNTLLNQIALDIKTVKKQLDVVEMKVELVNKRVEQVNNRVEQAQEETINALSDLMHEGYNAHEKRIKKIEEQLNPPQAQ